jgi:flavin-dependent dehydrogenase
MRENIKPKVNYVRRMPLENESLTLDNGSRVGIIGGGPAGAFFGYFLLRMAKLTGINLSVDIYERKDFCAFGPFGCNMCGGVVSESLIQALSREGIEIPQEVVQRSVDSIVFHSAEESVTLFAPFREMRMATVYRGAGPKNNSNPKWTSFDDFLLKLAASRGAKVIRETVTDLSWNINKPRIHTKTTQPQTYDLVVGALGVKSPNSDLFEKIGISYKKPHTRKTSNTEFELGYADVSTKLGNSMHAFLLDLPNLDFAALIPKGDYITMSLIGDNISSEFIDRFLQNPAVRNWLPVTEGHKSGACHCTPEATNCDAVHPYGDRVVLVGDCGMARLNKDGIGSAHRVAKTAAATALFSGISSRDFQTSYDPLGRAIKSDNRYGRVIFQIVKIIKKSRILTRATMRMARKEQNQNRKNRRMSLVLWDLFTGSAPYKEVFFRSLHPGFISGVISSIFFDSKAGQAVVKKQEETVDRRGQRKNYLAGEMIVHQGDVADCMYVVLLGQVEVIQSKDGQEVRLSMLKERDIFGEMAIFQKETWPATFRALTDANLLIVDQKTFLRRIHQDPWFVFAVMQKMSQRISSLNSELAQIKSGDGKET